MERTRRHFTSEQKVNMRSRGQSHNSNILTRVSPEHPVVAYVGPRGDAMGMEHEKYGATQAALIASRIFRTLVW
jgi:hypothetical protein